MHNCDAVVEVCQEELLHNSTSDISECYLETSHHVENLEHIEQGFAYLSIAILSLFLLENMLLIAAKPYVDHTVSSMPWS